MVKDQLQAMYTTLLNNHVQLLELLHEEAKGKEFNDSDDLFEYFNQLIRSPTS